MKQRILTACILAAVYAFDNAGLEDIAPDARGRSVLALNTTASGEAELLIYGPIGDYFWGDGVTAASIVEQLGQITATTINVRINSDGGVVTDGLAIYNALANHPATVNTVVDGIAASISSLIFMVGKTRRMHENSMLMIHGPQGGAWGFAGDLRERADVLDRFAATMQTNYAARATNVADVTTWLTDRKDHWFSASEAMTAGLADELAGVPEPAPDDTAVAAALLSYVQAISSSSPATVTASLRTKIQTTVTASAFSSLREAHQRAIYAQLEDSTMKHNCSLILAQAGGTGAAGAAPTASATAGAAPTTPVAAGASPDDVLAQLSARNESIRGVFANFTDIPGIRDLESACLADPRMSVEQAQGRLLARMGNGAGPLAGERAPATARGSLSSDETVVARDRIVQGILARAGVLEDREAEQARQDNPAARSSLISLAEDSLIRAGINTRSMTRDQIAAQVLAVQTTSDFPILLENTLHKILLAAYRLQAFTWRRFCAVGTLSDYRPHNRYHMGSFSDLKAVNEAGEYENGVLSDGAKETVQGKRKGRILQITPEVLVNDDMQAFTLPTRLLGQAAGRTIEKDVYALFALNSGNGPTMSDGNPLFHASHGNIGGTGGAPTVELIDAGRQAMATQMDVGGNDFLDIVPAIWLGPLALGSKARELNAMEYNDESNKQQRRPNVVRGLFNDVVDTPRLSGAPWYMLADPNLEPVFEVSFLDGVETPTLEQEKNFRTDGLSWKVVHRYATGAVGWRGVHKNPGQ